MSVDPLELKIVWERLVSAVNAATQAQKMSAFSTAVTEANDFACGLLTSRGDLIATSDIGMPSFANMLAGLVRALIDRGDLDTVAPGDVYICNDPWIAAAQVNDIGIVEPIFRAGKLEAFAVSIAHNPDLGGVQEWSRARDVHEEGLMIPPLKLVEAGTRAAGVWALIAANSRVPDQTIGDIEAQLVAVRAIGLRTAEILDEYGEVRLDTWAEQIMARTEARMRAAITALPDGVYEAEKRFSRRDLGVMVEPDREVVLHATVTVSGDQMAIDYSRTSDAVPGSVNALLPFTLAYSIYTIRLLLAPEIAHNDGFARPLSITAREGSAVAALRPNPTLNRHLVGHRLADLLTQAIAPVVPERARAESGSAPSWVLILTALEGRYRNMPRLLAIAGGTGAGADSDGQTVQFPVNVASTPVEVLERFLPLTIVSKQIAHDSVGNGARVGGPGQVVELLAEGPMACVFMGGGMDAGPRGLFGGSAGTPGTAERDGQPITPGSFPLEAGSRLTFRTPGGGGYGSTST